ncbi:LysR substrate-binding domain-containing protein [Sneathiella limimaris]|uniref:LysR substrate-binding domain-containing protein n=1 Tax=Sneathiella limimaris TaxID=1964213 RepID=UPI001469A8F1|nr:LysR substrate-binding domain-containing protein [Sneathiella limimaris]
MTDMSNGLNFRQLEIFNSVVEEGSTTKSAIRLGMSQPAVSRNVTQLEKDLGLDLFNREGGRLVPTEAALRLHAATKKAFDGIEDVVNSARNKESLTTGQIQIAAVPSLSLSLLPHAIKRFLDDYPDVKVTVETRTSRSAMEMVADHRVDAALVSMPITHPGLKTESLGTPRAVCVVPDGHPLGKKEVITIEDIKDENLIPMSRAHHSRHRLEELFSAAGYIPKVRLETSTIEMACVLVEEGLGITIVNEITAERHRRLGVQIRPFKYDMKYDYAFAYPASQPISELTRIFATHLKNHVAYLMEQSASSSV